MRRDACLFVTAVCAAFLAACSDRIVAPLEAAMTSPQELLPRQLLFGNPERALVRISPDGRHLSWIAPRDGVLNVWVAPVDDPAAARAVTDDAERGVHVYFWAYTNRDIVYLQDQGGDENWRVYRVNLDSGERADLTPIEGIAARIEGVSHKHSGTILVGINERDPALHDIYRIDLGSTERTLVAENPGYVGMVTDDEYNVRFGMQMQPDGSVNVERLTSDGWQPFDRIPYEDTLTTSIVGFDSTNERLVMVDSRGRDTAALTLRDIENGDSRVLFADDRADVSNAMQHPVTREVEAAAINYDRVRWTVLDAVVSPDFEYLRELNDGELSVISRTLADDRWIVAYSLADRPVSYYHYDRRARAATHLFSNRPELEGRPLAPMHPLVIGARDGLELVSYLTLPIGADPDGRARPSAPLPLVLFVHGGPWARNSYGYDPFHQWLANRGYAVLSVNFRGSTGFGKAFVNAGDREWAAAMHDDLIDAVDWAVGEGVTSKDTVAIMGGSYGGYAALVGLTFTPQTFACGVSIVGPSNLVTLLESIPPYWAPMLEMFAHRVGDHRTEEGRQLLTSRSPLTHVGHIQRPLLIGQGANDPRVKQHESDQIVDAMRERNIPVTYVLYPDEGHGFVRPPNSLSFNAVAEGFLGACLGGRVEPVGEDFAGASIQVLEGAQHVPGLKDALDVTARD
jgi:dipeptidyl aminopeptidase/acylaminoacyl peptidase